MRLVYVLAASHSGSTLVSMLLASHRDICTAGELKASAIGDGSDYFCSCGQQIHDCGFWKRVSEHLTINGVDFNIADAQTDFRQGGSRYSDRLLRPLVRGRFLEGVRETLLALSPTWRRELPRIQENNAALAEVIVRLHEKPIIVDSSKVGIRLKYLLMNSVFDVKVIRLIRDGRGVALTYMQPARFAAAQDPTLQQRHEGSRMSMIDAAHAWRDSNREAEHLLMQLEDTQYTTVHYEAFCRDADGTLEVLFEFIGADPNVRIADFRAAEHHVLGNDMRLDRSSTICLDERWREVLTERDLREFDQIAGSMNRRYGYD